MTDTTLPCDLGDGLVLRRATPDDAAALRTFNQHVHSDEGWDQPDERVGHWTHDLLSGRHPHVRPTDCTVVEDTRNGAIVSSTILIPQTWAYDGIPFAVGRPELVATHPDYRRRGLVRAQFQVLHRWSAERAQQVQVITGIPWYYRQFGYELALDLYGYRGGDLALVPPLKPGAVEPYRVRPATAGDLNFIAARYDEGGRRNRLHVLRDAALWRHELEGRHPLSTVARELRIIETPQGEPVGYLVHPRCLWQAMLFVLGMELAPGISWLAVMPSVLRYLKTAGETAPPYAPGHTAELRGYAFSLHAEHPIHRVIPDRLPLGNPPFALYVRVPDVPGFLQHVAPALEHRLAESPVIGHSGELKISFFREGVRLVFEAGRITAEPWQPTVGDPGTAAFPDRTFLQLLFGYRTLQELRHAFADCYASPEAAVLLQALFPKQASNVWLVS